MGFRRGCLYLLRAVDVMPLNPIEGHAMKSIFVLASAATLFALGGCSHDETSQQPALQSQPVQQSQQIDPESSTDANAQTQVPELTGADASAVALYREAQALMKAEKHEEGYETAKKAMAQFIAEDNDLAWMLLESITLTDHRVDVHFNMGPPERNPPDNGIVKPLSFRVWSTGDDGALLKVIDFEIGRVDGESLTAAIGMTIDSGHANFGILPIDASYEAIKTAALDVVKRNDNG